MDRRKINEYYAEIGQDLIETEPSLNSVKESDVIITYLSSSQKKMSCGQPVLGQCEKIADKYKWGIPCDFTVTIFEPNIIMLDDDQIRALIHHELLHVGIDTDEDEREKYFIRPHDMVDFRLILEKYGVDWNLPKTEDNSPSLFDFVKDLENVSEIH